MKLKGTTSKGFLVDLKGSLLAAFNVSFCRKKCPAKLRIDAFVAPATSFLKVLR